MTQKKGWPWLFLYVRAEIPKGEFMRFIYTIMCGLLLAGALSAQTGAITGDVRDPADAIVVGANVVITNTVTGAESRTKSTSTGSYSVPGLPVGVYRLVVDVPGFKKYTVENIQVQVDTTARANVRLTVGSAAESVTVTDETPLLKTETGEQSTVIAGADVNQLPLNYGGGAGSTGNIRSPFAFNILSPGITGTGQDGGVVNGLPRNTFRMQVAGQDATSQNDPGWTSTVAAPAVDMIQEFSIQTSNFAAEFGQAGGGFYNFSMKSGGNQFHGTAFEYWTNEVMNAARPYTGLSPRSRKNDFGGTIGGPVWIPKVYDGRNKTFFFFSWESFRNKVFSTGNTLTVPTDQMRGGDFSYALTGKTLGNDISGTAILENAIYDPQSNFTVNGQVVRRMFPGNIIPKSRLDPTALKFQNLFPLATNGGLTDNYDQNYLNPRYQTLPSFTVDQVFKDQSRLQFYGSFENTDQLTAADGLPPAISRVRVQAIFGNTVRLNYDKAFTPTLLAHFGFGYQLFHNPDSSPADSLQYDAAGQLGFIGSATNPSGYPRLTNMDEGPFDSGMVDTGPTNANSYYDGNLTAPASLTWVHGNHTVKAGAEFRISSWQDRNSRGAQGILNFAPDQTALPYLNQTSVRSGSTSGDIGNGYASFLLGLVDTASVNAVQDPQLRKKAWAFYIQDTWKVTRKFTLDYGLRYDLQGQGHEIHYRTNEFSFTRPDPLANNIPGAFIFEGYGPGRCNCQFTNTYKYAFGPRLGGAYSFDEKTVIRGGIGVSYGTPPTSSYITNGALQGVGFNSISFNNSANGGFGFPAVNLGTGLIYDHSALTDATLDPGLITPLSEADILAGRTQATSLGAANRFFYLDPHARPPRILSWSLGVQREVLKNLTIESSWVANVGVWEQSNTLNAFNQPRPEVFAAYGIDPHSQAGINTLNASMSSDLGRASGVPLPYPSFPTSSTVLQALRPFPQVNGNFSSRWAPLGKSWYQSWQTKITRRFSRGLTAQSAITWSKALTDPTNNNDIFNRANHKSLQSTDVPLIFNTGFSYEVQRPRSLGFLGKVIGGWTVSGVLQYQSGGLISVPMSANPQIGGQNSSENRVPGVPLFLHDLNCHCFDPQTDFVLNPAAWQAPAIGQFGTAAPYYNDYRFARKPTESITFGRRFQIGESKTFEIRAEFFNIFNRMQIPNPEDGSSSINPQTTRSCSAPGASTYTVGSSNSCTAGPGVRTSGFGAISTANIGGPRNGQIVARFTF
jgi:hypothetical protein